MFPDMTPSEVVSHNRKDDLYVVINDQVYDCTDFLHRHPGGEAVLLDVGGGDATDAFVNVGHSQEARDVMRQLFIGHLRRQARIVPG
ncbi:cytochrome b5 [Colletotrichum incanum]|uniref:Cytochrome b5 n=1 Tax=Colletotrichum incanum TaxID=1573173 RepID=A0A167BM66_COLIC|nr:cytochrome b5 [Colletotrichum incanum]OHW90375.1 cytochrome b5 [Colletotrichum incanum]